MRNIGTEFTPYLRRAATIALRPRSGCARNHTNRLRGCLRQLRHRFLRQPFGKHVIGTKR
jgi:hypothetical protein